MTSRFHDRSYSDIAPSTQAAEEDYHRRWLKSNARFQPSWETRAYERLNADLSQPGIDGASAKLLVEIYWAWQAPLHNCVYRRCFFRDMALDGPYFSKFLLNVILAHACRHTKTEDPTFSNFEKGESFLKRAKALLVEEMEVPKIPTIQGLLILGGRQCAIGRNSEGWLYTSMAISMIRDLGLHLPKPAGHLLTEMEPDDLEARKRLYLSAFAWDKSISLCLGRPPQLREMPYQTECLFDNADDEQEWKPVHFCMIDPVSAIPTISHTTSTFTAFCKLAGMADKLYAELYSPSVKNTNACNIQELEHQIREIYGCLPTCLRLHHDDPETPSPPPHILCLNVFYHTLLILLYRPFCELENTPATDATFSDHARKVCTQEAALVNIHFQAYGRAFNYQNQTYLLSYCVYTAATIEVQHLRDRDELVAIAAAKRLSTTLSMLEVEAEQTPGIRRSVDIIRSQIGRMPRSHPIAQSHQVERLTTGTDGTPRGSQSLPIQGAAQHTLPTSISGQDSSANSFEMDSDLSIMEFDATTELPWFDWNAFDISGGFPLYNESTWPPQ